MNGLFPDFDLIVIEETGGNLYLYIIQHDFSGAFFMSREPFPFRSQEEGKPFLGEFFCYAVFRQKTISGEVPASTNGFYTLPQ